MADFLLELRSEEIPARMQDKARADLARLFAAELEKAGLKADEIVTYATPRRLALIARGLPAETEAVSEELKGPRASAPPQALEGFLRKTGLTQDQLVERDGILFAVIERPGRATSAVLAEAIPAIIRAFPWPKSMRWGEASLSSESLRWVRPLQGIVAILGDDVVDFEIAGIASGAATLGHRFHHPGPITIGGAHDYVEKLRACHVIVDQDERRTLIADGAAKAAADAGLHLVEDDGLLAENAGLTEWPVPLLGAFDPAFLDVPREVIQLTLRTNQKYFVLNNSSPSLLGEGDHPKDGGGASSSLAPNFLCVANIDAADGGARIVEGNRKVLAARLADARFFWEQDVKVPLAAQAEKLGQIVFHEKLGTVADKVERVAKLARWLVEEGIVRPVEASARPERSRGALARTPHERPSTSLGTSEVGRLADLAERAARLCKADLVTGLVGEFPELQGVIGGHLARAQGEPPEVADAIRDHYKPVGQGDDVPTAPVTVAVSLADKLDSLAGFFAIGQTPTGSKDPFALRRAAISAISLVVKSNLRFDIGEAVNVAAQAIADKVLGVPTNGVLEILEFAILVDKGVIGRDLAKNLIMEAPERFEKLASKHSWMIFSTECDVTAFIRDRLEVQQRDVGIRGDILRAVFSVREMDDLVSDLARVKALQSFVETPEGADLLAGYKRAANILKKEGWPPSERHPELVSGSSPETPEAVEDWMLKQVQHDGDREQPANKPLSYTPENAETALIAALDSAGPRAEAAVAAEDFEGAMAALASLRAPVDAFFEEVTVNDPDPDKRAARLDLLARMRDAVHRVADFSRIEG